MTLDDLFRISKGKKPSVLTDNSSEDTIPFIQIDGVRNTGQHQYCKISPDLVICDRNDILIVWDGAYCGLAGFGCEGAIGSTIARLRPKAENVFGPYAGHFLRSKFEEIQKNAIGAAIPHVNGGHLRRLDIALPPLNEQKRIAAVMDRVDALRRQRQEALRLTEKLLQSVFIDMFVRTPDAVGWIPRTVEWMAKNDKGSIRTGPFGSQLLHSEFVDHGIAVLGIDNAVKNRFEWGRPRFITPEKYQGLRRYKVFPGDLIITIMGTLGRSAVVPDNIPEAINTKHLCCITLNQMKCLPEFLHAAFLNHPDILRQLGVRTKGAVMPGLNMGIIKDLELPLPPIELQEEFKRIVDLGMTSRIDLEDSQEAVEELFSSIQQRAFRGELGLSRLTLEDESPVAAPTTGAVAAHGRYRRPGSFIAPPEIEAHMMALEAKLEADPSNSIAWNENYFKYRLISQVLKPPFSFADIWGEAEHDIEEPSYDTVKDTVFRYMEDRTLKQQFDETRKEIVFTTHP
ncbi:MAG: EcoKI restriction-modification system protein HsdS [Chthonomonadaceae bacterium]|nr:EcoKI restriction-modification system protein HsdS [Chthonomonadaceae bacterium]